MGLFFFYRMHYFRTGDSGGQCKIMEGVPLGEVLVSAGPPTTSFSGAEPLKSTTEAGASPVLLKAGRAHLNVVMYRANLGLMPASPPSFISHSADVSASTFPSKESTHQYFDSHNISCMN